MHTREEAEANRWKPYNATVNDYQREMVHEFYKVRAMNLKLQKAFRRDWNNGATINTVIGRSTLRHVQSSEREVALDKRRLNLLPLDIDPSGFALNHSKMMQCFFLQERPVVRKIISVEDFANHINQLRSIEPTDGSDQPSKSTVIFPRFYDELVLNKGISEASGTFTVAHGYSKTVKSLVFTVVHARELRGEWLEELNLRAFKVAAFSDRHYGHTMMPVGYVVRSSMDVPCVPAISLDLSKAVSLCKRRVKAEVLKRMGAS